jgi:hypothetical protein
MLDGKTLLLSGIASVLLVWIYFTGGTAPNYPPAATPNLLLWVVVGGCTFVAAFLMLRTYRYGSVSKRFVLLTIGALMAALVMASTRPVADSIVNGSWRARNANLAALTEQRAGPDFKPSAAAKPDWHSPVLYLRSQGVPVYELFTARNWAVISAASFLGVYGYMNIFAPPLVYSVLGYSFLLVCLLVGFCMVRNSDLRPFAFVSLVSAVLIILDSVLTSWTRDFQPQGRYLFPLLCILGLMLYIFVQRGRVQKSWLSLSLIKVAVLVSYSFSAGSFLFVALRLIEK